MKAKLIFAALAACVLATTATAQEQHGWRGANRDGIYHETGLLKEWAATGPEQLWETLDAGKGYSSPVIVGDRLYITGMNEDETQEIFSAYSLDGKKIYAVEYSEVWNKTYPETRTTPAIVDEKAYVISGMGRVVCLNIEDGSEAWSVDGVEQFGSEVGTWGTSECPLVFDGKVIYCPGGQQTAVVALDASTGATIWKSKSLEQKNNYASPLLIEHMGKQQIIALTAADVIGVNPENGEIEWTYGDWGQNMLDNGWEKIAPNTPLYKDGKIFVCNGYNMDSFMLQLNNDLTGVELLWSSNVMDTHVGGFVLVDGIIYGSNWEDNSKGNWAAIDWNTGETKYDHSWGSGKSKGSIIAADSMLYIYDEKRGYVGLLRATPDQFDLVSEFRITKGEGPHWAHPVIADGVLYIRHGNALMAYEVK